MATVSVESKIVHPAIRADFFFPQHIAAQMVGVNRFLAAIIGHVYGLQFPVVGWIGWRGRVFRIGNGAPLGSAMSLDPGDANVAIVLEIAGGSGFVLSVGCRVRIGQRLITRVVDDVLEESSFAAVGVVDKHLS